MPPRETRDVLELIEYPDDTAGGLMVKEYVAYPDDYDVEHVISDLRRNRAKYSDYDIQYVYVISAKQTLVGVLRLRDILFSSRLARLKDIMIGDPYKVEARFGLAELEEFFIRHNLYGAPVLDSMGRLIGVVKRKSQLLATAKRDNLSFLKFIGIIGGEEFRSMKLTVRSGRRLSWLSINIVLNIVAASVIALYQDTLEKAIVLAVFLPIISDMSGCSGNQAVAVSLRELALGLIRPVELLRVFLKESCVGIINGLVLGCVLACITIFMARKSISGPCGWHGSCG
jgi:magnesium transporter